MVTIGPLCIRAFTGSLVMHTLPELLCVFAGEFFFMYDYWFTKSHPLIYLLTAPLDVYQTLTVEPQPLLEVYPKRPSALHVTLTKSNELA